MVERVFTTSGALRVMNSCVETDANGCLTIFVENFDDVAVTIANGALVAQATLVEHTKELEDLDDVAEREPARWYDDYNKFQREMSYQMYMAMADDSGASLHSLIACTLPPEYRSFAASSAAQSYGEHAGEMNKEDVSNAKIGYHLTKGQEKQVKDFLQQYLFFHRKDPGLHIFDQVP
jgi:hypothetical protein